MAEQATETATLKQIENNEQIAEEVASENEEVKSEENEAPKEKKGDKDDKKGKGDKKDKKKKGKKKKKMRKLIRKIAEACEDQEGFDIYQWNAFASWVYKDADGFVAKTNEAHRKKELENEVPEDEIEDLITPITGRQYAYYAFQAIVTCILQTVGMIVLFYRVLQDGTEARGWCDMDGAVDAKLVVIAFSFYVGFTVNGWLESIKSSGMYAIFGIIKAKEFQKQGHSKWENVPFFITLTWVMVGYYANLFALFVSLYLSYFIIFFSDNTFDIILNSVAVFFMLEIDDLMLTATKYEQIEAFVDSLRNDKKTIVVPDEYHDLGDSKAPKCPCIFSVIRWIVMIMLLVSWVSLFAVPILMVICY